MKLLTSIFSPLFEHTAHFLLWTLLWCQKCLRTQWTAAMNAWIDMQQTSPLCYPACAVWAWEIEYISESFGFSLFSGLK